MKTNKAHPVVSIHNLRECYIHGQKKKIKDLLAERLHCVVDAHLLDHIEGELNPALRPFEGTQPIQNKFMLPKRKINQYTKLYINYLSSAMALASLLRDLEQIPSTSLTNP
jgi:hypothetical protein